MSASNTFSFHHNLNALFERKSKREQRNYKSKNNLTEVNCIIVIKKQPRVFLAFPYFCVIQNF